MENIYVTLTKLWEKNLLQDQNSGDKICYRKRIVEKNLFHAQNCGNVFLLQEMSYICNFYDKDYMLNMSCSKYPTVCIHFTLRMTVPLSGHIHNKVSQIGEH